MGKTDTLPAVRGLILIAVLFAAEFAFARGPVVSVVVLPTRTETLAARGRAIAADLARAWHGDVATSRAPIADLTTRFDQAQKRVEAGDVDRAANLYDVALDEGARAIDRVASGRAFVTALVERVAIALARGEDARTRELLERLVTYDPTFVLDVNERSPLLRAALDRVDRSTLRELDAAPAICQDVDVVLVVRTSDARRLLVSRYDGCQHIRSVVGTEDEIVATLASASPSTRSRTPTPTPTRPARAKLIGGAIGLGLGLALTATGIYFAAKAADDHSNLNTSCVLGSSCAGEELLRRGDQYHLDTALGSTLTTIGALGAVAGAVVLYFGLKGR